MDSIISHGCFLRECSVEHSIVGIRSRLEYGVELKVIFLLFIYLFIHKLLSILFHVFWLKKLSKVLTYPDDSTWYLCAIFQRNYQFHCIIYIALSIPLNPKVIISSSTELHHIVFLTNLNPLKLSKITFSGTNRCWSEQKISNYCWKL